MESGIVYLLHFDKPIGNLASPRGQAQHYLGSTKNLNKRLQAHARGYEKSAKIVQFVVGQGITLTVARTWLADDPRALEKKLKGQHNNRRFCPICAMGGER